MRSRALLLSSAAALIGGLLAAVAPAALVAPGQAAGARGTAGTWVPAGKQVSIIGHGYGHGQGLSQYGAQGAALQGLNYVQILKFYYPGTSFSRFDGTVKVLLTRDNDDDLVVLARPGLSLRDLGAKKSIALPRPASVRAWRLSTSAGTVRVAYLNTRWNTWRAHPVLQGSGEFRAGGPITLDAPDVERSYRGFLRYTRADTVNVVAMNDYLKGVVPAEMPSSWHRAALRAQVVAARTYAAWSRSARLGQYWELCDTSSCQVYGGVDSERDSTTAAVELTPAYYLSYAGRPASTWFSASNGGWSAAGDQPYLVARSDPYDDYPGNGVHDWSVQADLTRLQRAYPELGGLVRLQVLTRDGHGDWGGRVESVRLDGRASDVTITGARMRTVLGLRSTWFTFPGR